MADQMTDERIQECREVFEQFTGGEDCKHAGIKISQLIPALKQLLRKPTEEKLQEKMSAVEELDLASDDDDGDTIIKFPEFLVLLAEKHNCDGGGEEEIIEQLRKYVKDNTDRLPLRDLSRILAEEFDEKISDEEIRDMVEQFGGADEEGKVNIEQFVKGMMSL